MPLGVACPATSIFSLMVTGTPCSGPRSAPLPTSRSFCAAARNASSPQSTTIALMRPLCRAMRPKHRLRHLDARCLARPDHRGELDRAPPPQFLGHGIRTVLGTAPVISFPGAKERWSWSGLLASSIPACLAFNPRHMSETYERAEEDRPAASDARLAYAVGRQPVGCGNTHAAHNMSAYRWQTPQPSLC